MSFQESLEVALGVELDGTIVHRTGLDTEVQVTALTHTSLEVRFP